MGLLSRLRSRKQQPTETPPVEVVRLWITRNEARDLFKICEEIFNKGYKTQTLRGRKKLIMSQVNESYGKIKDKLGIKVIKE